MGMFGGGMFGGGMGGFGNISSKKKRDYRGMGDDF
jgi:hypothetical protein